MKEERREPLTNAQIERELTKNAKTGMIVLAVLIPVLILSVWACMTYSVLDRMVTYGFVIVYVAVLVTIIGISFCSYARTLYHVKEGHYTVTEERLAAVTTRLRPRYLRKRYVSNLEYVFRMQSGVECAVCLGDHEGMRLKQLGESAKAGDPLYMVSLNGKPTLVYSADVFYYRP